MFCAPVFLRTVPDAAAIGAALRAKHGYLCSSSPSSSPNQEELRADAHVESTASAHGGKGAGSGAAYVPFSNVLPAAEEAAAAAAVGGGGGKEGTRGSEGGGADMGETSARGRRSSKMMRLAATPQKDVDAVYEGMAER